VIAAVNRGAVAVAAIDGESSSAAAKCLQWLLFHSHSQTQKQRLLVEFTKLIFVLAELEGSGRHAFTSRHGVNGLAMKHVGTRYFATDSPASSRQAQRDGIKPLVLPSLARPMKVVNITEVTPVRSHLLRTLKRLKALLSRSARLFHGRTAANDFHQDCCPPCASC
jgi:hypothetical protein